MGALHTPLTTLTPHCVQPLGAIAWPDYYGYTTAGLWSSDIHFGDTNGYPDFIIERDCWNVCSGNLSQIGYCTAGQPLSQCCVVAAVEKYKSELWLQLVAKQWNASSSINNTNDVQIKVSHRICT